MFKIKPTLKKELVLNDNILLFREFYGKTVEQMPMLVSGKDKEGNIIDVPRTPLSVYGLMQKRLAALDQHVSEEVRQTWWINYFDTADGSAADGHGNLKIIFDAQHIRELTPDTKLKLGVIEITDKTYDSLEGEEFTTAEVEKYTGQLLRRGKSLHNPFWLTLARYDKHLLKEYDDAVFAFAQMNYGYTTAMKVDVAPSLEFPNLRLWSIAVGTNQSGAGSFGMIPGCAGRLIGIAPEVSVLQQMGRFPEEQEITMPTLEQVLALGKKHISAAGIDAFREDVWKLYRK